MEMTENNRSSWLDQRLFNTIVINREKILWTIIIILAIISRFYDLESRVMSHDENSHVYYSWRFYKGQGFAHDPLMHGPFQFHVIALSYFIFGDNDFTARIPAALLSIATVAFMWNYRRYLGKAGALIAATMMLISPYMLYYGRYVRNEAYVAFFGVVTIWAILRYLESGENRYMYWLTAATVLHFTAKETAFIYTAQALLFLAFYFVFQVSQENRLDFWVKDSYRKRFLFALILGLLLLAAVGGYLLSTRSSMELSPTETVAPSIPGEELGQLASGGPPTILLVIAILSGFALIAAAYFLLRGYTWERLRNERSFGLLILLSTLVLPQLAAFTVRFMGWDIPTNASEVTALTINDIVHIGIFLVPLAIISIVIGLIWNPREWLINAAIFYGLFTVFYTSVFTNGAGFFTGLVGSLGYWLEQQGVQRGSQPLYYYWLVQIPVYEYLPALGSLIALGIAVAVRFTGNQGEVVESDEEENLEPQIDYNGAPVFSFLGFWTVTSLFAYSIAGEKMPWLTVHIAFPAILLAAWAFGRLVEMVDWSAFRKQRGWLAIVLFIVFLLSLFSVLGSLLGVSPPFQGKELVQLQATSTFITSLIITIASGVGLYYILKPWSATQILSSAAVVFLGFLGVLTARSAILATYINYDNANELLVYAHSASGVKVALDQIEEISQRTTDGLAVVVAYDNETSYPYWWYLRNYPNARYYGSDPSRSLREVPLILVGDANFGKIEPVVGNLYHRFDYIRLWWPNQDYFGLTWERIKGALLNPDMRAALFNIWIDRDYELYGQVTGKDMSFPNWSPAAQMRLYIRKDLVNQLWNFGVAPSPEVVEPDPFEGKHISLTAERIFGSQGMEPGQFQHPRDIEVSEDGSLYVADSDNHRIQQISTDGSVLNVWGSFGDVAAGEAPAGTFNQPWGIGIGTDGSVFVADTWNHRVQKFSPQGEFLTMWGYFGQGEQPQAFWGPRDVAVDPQGRVFVTDTGNKRVTVFDSDGNFITQFGELGMGPGQLDEPVGLTIDKDGQVYIADTWNQRIQVFSENENGEFIPLRSWEVWAWYGQSLDNKPFISVDDLGSVFAADPEGYRVLQFSQDGEAIRSWGDFGTGAEMFAIPASVSTDKKGGVWVTDSGNNRIMYFILPEP